jgi:hypothetical protein
LIRASTRAQRLGVLIALAIGGLVILAILIVLVRGIQVGDSEGAVTGTPTSPAR